MKRLLLAVLVAAIPFLASTSHAQKWTVGQTVQTTGGLVEGHAASVASGVSEYLGIPYAQPPVGRLRFQPPLRYNGSSKIDGGNFGAVCFASNISAFDADFPQKLVDTYGITDVGRRTLGTITNPGISMSEDCLTLNIWTKPQTGERKKAVMVYIHGGSFVSGSSAVPAYNGQFFADQEDVVLVTINYRLSFFGFPGIPHGRQNLGLLDQRLALEWVRDNIASFGGDPSRITVFGESAGGASVDHHSFAWPHDPIVAGIISMSGTAAGLPIRDPALATALWYNTTSALGCGDASSSSSNSQDKVLTCMQFVPAESIIRTLINTIDAPISLPYGPTIDHALVFPPSQYYTRNSTHPAARVSLLIGHTDNETGLFRVFVPRFENDTAHFQQENQNTFVCPVAARAARSVREGNPTWRYRWHGVWPNTELATKPVESPSGAYHYSEVPLLFGNVDQTLIKNTRAQEEVGRFFRGAWAAFARDPVRGLVRYRGEERKGNGEGWPRYEPGKETLARLGWEGKPGLNLVGGDDYDWGC